jgi:hypothetical protein
MMVILCIFSFCINLIVIVIVITTIKFENAINIICKIGRIADTQIVE